mmetsp:Transcript_104099/g.293555  ORF Transcript_104099/g.293555 Transcript_104099/m.293555 type:complete len:701 (-) Transcript_104099:8-2110(-)
MGNAGCVGEGTRGVSLDALCAGRNFLAFKPPNSKFVTYSFNAKRQQTIQFCGEREPRPVEQHGFQIESPLVETSALKWYTVKENIPHARQLRLCVSGRFLLRIPDPPTLNTTPEGVCAFRICTRGCPVYESVRTLSFTHTAQVVTSGVFFSLSVAVQSICTSDGRGPAFNLLLCPRILLVLASGDEVVLVEDRLGPLQAPQAFYADFAIVDDGGRNVQLDLIFRAPSAEDGCPAEDGGEPRKCMRTLRTCLQDYIALNSQIQPASVSLGYSCIASNMPTATVHLQNLVVSEDRLFKDGGSEPQPFDVWKEAAHRPEKETFSKILFEGSDARVASMAIDVPEAPMTHPQLQSIRAAPQRFGAGAPASNNGAASFWHHVRYGESPDGGALDVGSAYCPQLQGEFWLSRSQVDNKNVYFHCSSTLAQALTMCIVFRFRCPLEYLKLIETQASHALRDTHIPTNGIVLGVERDPRHGALMRMFVEHRNKIIDDMIVCECRPADLAQCVVHQEVYDSGGTMRYRLTLVHSDGARQSAVLQVNMDEVEDPSLDSARSAANQQEQNPSLRFPIVPCSAQHKLTPVNRIFVYTGKAYEPPEDAFDADNSEGIGESIAEFGTPDCGSRIPEYWGADSMVDEWQSIGDHSDGEFNQARSSNAPAASRLLSQRADAGRMGEVRWRRPLIESVVLLGRLEDPPFRCFPRSLS